MARNLANYTGISVPDLGDPRATAAGQVSGGVGGDFVGAVDDHDHTLGRGARLSQASFEITGDLGLNGNGLVEVEYLALEAGGTPTGPRQIFADGGGDLKYRDGSETDLDVASEQFVSTQLTAIAPFQARAWARIQIVSGVPTLLASAGGLSIQALSTNILTLAFSPVRPNANYVVVVSNHDSSARVWSTTSHAVNLFGVFGNRADSGALLDLTTGTYNLGLVVFGDA